MLVPDHKLFRKDLISRASLAVERKVGSFIQAGAMKDNICGGVVHAAVKIGTCARRNPCLPSQAPRHSSTTRNGKQDGLRVNSEATNVGHAPQPISIRSAQGYAWGRRQDEGGEVSSTRELLISSFKCWRLTVTFPSARTRE